jgi:hypothetical protein
MDRYEKTMNVTIVLERTQRNEWILEDQLPLWVSYYSTTCEAMLPEFFARIDIDDFFVNGVVQQTSLTIEVPVPPGAGFFIVRVGNSRLWTEMVSVPRGALP